MGKVCRSIFDLDKINVTKIKTQFCNHIKQASKSFKYLEVISVDRFQEKKMISALNGCDMGSAVASELNKKLVQVKEIELGFISNLILLREGLSTTAKVEMFASMLQDHFGNSKGWSDLAIEFLSERQIDQAIEIFENQLVLKEDLMPINEKAYVINHIVKALCDLNKFEEALEFFEFYRGKQPSAYLNQTLDMDCLISMREISLKMKCFDFYEKINQKYPGDISDQIRSTFNLIESLLIEDPNKAYNIYKKFDSSQIDMISNDFEKNACEIWYTELMSRLKELV